MENRFEFRFTNRCKRRTEGLTAYPLLPPQAFDRFIPQKKKALSFRIACNGKMLNGCRFATHSFFVKNKCAPGKNRKRANASSDKTMGMCFYIYDQWANDFLEFWRQMFVMVADFDEGQNPSKGPPSCLSAKVKKNLSGQIKPNRKRAGPIKTNRKRANGSSDKTMGICFIFTISGFTRVL